MHCIVPTKSGEVEGIRQGSDCQSRGVEDFDSVLTKRMHCIVPSGSWWSSVFARGLTIRLQFIVPVSGGISTGV